MTVIIVFVITEYRSLGTVNVKWKKCFSMCTIGIQNRLQWFLEMLQYSSQCEFIDYHCCLSFLLQLLNYIWFL